jgi:hypothetical protein
MIYRVRIPPRRHVRRGEWDRGHEVNRKAYLFPDVPESLCGKLASPVFSKGTYWLELLLL